MDIKMGVCCFFLWLVTLTATVQGQKTCSELEAGQNSITLGGKSYQVECDRSNPPASTIIKVIGKTAGIYQYAINYAIPLSAIAELVQASETCKQVVSYACKNATEFTSGQVTWYTTTGKGVKHWGECEGACKCENSGTTESRILSKLLEIPVAKVSVQAPNVTIGDLVCTGDLKGAVTFKDRSSYSSVNLTHDTNEISFKFKLSRPNSNKTIAKITLKDSDYIQIGVGSDNKIFVGYNDDTKTFVDLDEAWHTVKVVFDGSEVKAFLDKKEQVIKEIQSDTKYSARVKLIFGQNDCYSFVGCVKDLHIGGKSFTAQLLSSPEKRYVVVGCQDLDSDDIRCNPGGGGGKDKPSPTGGGDLDDDDDDGDDSDTAVIVIVVILLLLLIFLLIAFFITWYLKRNKGVYQTHEGSAEDIHGDTDNLTLVTKPTEQEDEAQKSKEYYL